MTRRPPSSASVRVHADRDQTGPAGFTLFELLAVLTVTGIILTLIIGSYGSWGTARALDGAARTVEAGLAHARALAVSRHAYVAFSYGTTNTAPLSVTTGFQPFLLQPTNATDSVETALSTFLISSSSTLADIPSGTLDITPLAPFQRLPGHIRLLRSGSASESQVIFRPDGSAFLEASQSQPTTYSHHTIELQTAESFPVGQTATAPLARLFRIDPATGLATLFGDRP